VDGLATIAGQRLKSKAYSVFGQRKTVAGTAAAILSSIGIIAGLAAFSDVAFTISSFSLGLLVFPLIAALAENFSPYGSDNLTIPLAVLGLCSLFGF
jgi:phytol kinase